MNSFNKKYRSVGSLSTMRENGKLGAASVCSGQAGNLWEEVQRACAQQHRPVARRRLTLLPGQGREAGLSRAAGLCSG